VSEKAYKPEKLDFKKLMLIDYVVYGIEKLSGILAWYQLQDTEYLSKIKFQSQYQKEKRRIYNIIQNHVIAGEFTVTISEETIVNESWDDIYGYEVNTRRESIPCIKLAEFAAWANNSQDFKCPQVILDKAIIKISEVNSEPHGNENKGGAPRGALTEAVEEAYMKFWKEGNTEILRKGKIRDFLERLKELADERGNPNFSKYIADRIDSVKISPSGCIITTKDEVVESSNSRENIIKGQKYKQQRVSQHLTQLRKEYPLPA
jgi:hypothetical protein